MSQEPKSIDRGAWLRCGRYLAWLDPGWMEVDTSGAPALPSSWETQEETDIAN